MNYGIVYATGSKMVRRIIVSDDEKALDQRHVGLGESLLLADKAKGSDLFAARAAVKLATGIDPPSHECAVVDKVGAVVKIIAADPAIDTVEGHDLVAAYKGVTTECTYDNASDTFTAPVKTIPASIDEKGNPVPQKTVGGPVPKPAAVSASAADSKAG